ncbi:transcriptional regulator, MarR family [Micromonospora nigra]|uniref:Transcriptional regulator, MarR family n=1 Tax=Micromonospora nigra TaxID=145857 RepID=A0A1C6S7J7_9ACTN|nr:MarR family transcriptional regulator [Micromonospora nigra]SCL25437.1 transcriptional regulator, MarR family [Micromonospora nigra]
MTGPDPLERTPLTFLLGMAFQLVLTEFVAELDAIGYHDLRPIHGLVFQLLQGSGATSTELARQLGVTKQAAGQIVDHLERAGYVERRPYPLGGRRKLVVLTDKGREHMRTAGRVLSEIESRLAAGSEDEGLGVLREELARMIRSLAGDDVPPLRPFW